VQIREKVTTFKNSYLTDAQSSFALMRMLLNLGLEPPGKHFPAILRLRENYINFSWTKFSIPSQNLNNSTTQGNFQ